MKRIILIVITFLLMSTVAWAAPFLVCDPYSSSDGVLRFTGTVDGVAFETPYSLHPSGAAIIYDMGSLNLSVTHSFGDVRACSAVGCSQPASTFVSPPIPGDPRNLRFVN